ncbi:MAG: hypothetical protein JXB50_15485 [Spirochaetes bacterium]|nr:hypothetical protein [Spirochaetota bacterium]
MSYKKYSIIFFCLFNFLIFSQTDDDLIVGKIYQILVEEYDKYENTTFEERLVLKFGRKAFMESIDIWKKNYKNLDQIEIILHPRLEHMAKTAEENLAAERAEYFRNLLVELTFLSYQNLQIFYLAVKDYLIEHDLNQNDISKKIIDTSISMPKFFYIKMDMYDREEIIKTDIRAIMDEGKIKYKLAFYAFAFDFLNKIRKKIIKKDIERMKVRMEAINKDKMIKS